MRHSEHFWLLSKSSNSNLSETLLTIAVRACFDQSVSMAYFYANLGDTVSYKFGNSG